MKTTRFTGFVCVALAMFALPAAAQAKDGITPANNTLCDPLSGGTSGLYGVCVAMCEAQNCTATIDPDNGEVTFDDTCGPSSDRLLINYINIYEKRGDPEDPPVPPCVTVACPCWSETAIDNIGGASDTCLLEDSFVGLYGPSTDGGGTEWAYAMDYGTRGPSCMSLQTRPTDSRNKAITADEYTACKQSVIDEIASRGLKC